MSDSADNSKAVDQIDRQKLWEKYEDIAMHFNDLLMRLRSQSLAGVAGITTLVGVFTKIGKQGPTIDWPAATAILFAVECFWIAIFCLDIFYYNKLLVGAVEALTKLEGLTITGQKNENEQIKIDRTSHPIEMSTFVEKVFGECLPKFIGVYLFYGIVAFVLSLGVYLSFQMANA